MYTEKELAKLIEDVEKEFTAHLAKTEESNSSLAKSEGEAVSLAKAEEEAEKKPAKEESESEEKPAVEAKDESKDEPKDETKAPAEEGKKEEKPAAESEEHGYDEEDLEHMNKMYGSMSKAELKAHHDAIKGCLDKCGDITEVPMGKSEDISVEVKEEVQSPEEVNLLKSEIEAKDAKVAELQKNLDVATEFLTKLFSKKSAPAAKAITSLESIAKSEHFTEEKTLTKSEITSILAKKAADPSTTKSDREAINDYYLGSKSLQKINHLLK